MYVIRKKKRKSIVLRRSRTRNLLFSSTYTFSIALQNLTNNTNVHIYIYISNIFYPLLIRMRLSIFSFYQYILIREVKNKEQKKPVLTEDVKLCQPTADISAGRTIFCVGEQKQPASIWCLLLISVFLWWLKATSPRRHEDTKWQKSATIVFGMQIEYGQPRRQRIVFMLLYSDY